MDCLILPPALFRPLRGVLLSAADHVQRLIAFARSSMARGYRQLAQLFHRLSPLRKVWSDHLNTLIAHYLEPILTIESLTLPCFAKNYCFLFDISLIYTSTSSFTSLIPPHHIAIWRVQLSILCIPD